nr:MAG TPA: hypothetical protein [Caudoviricetes sp.]
MGFNHAILHLSVIGIPLISDIGKEGCSILVGDFGFIKIIGKHFIERLFNRFRCNFFRFIQYPGNCAGFHDPFVVHVFDAKCTRIKCCIGLVEECGKAVCPSRYIRVHDEMPMRNLFSKHLIRFRMQYIDPDSFTVIQYHFFLVNSFFHGYSLLSNHPILHQNAYTINKLCK